MDILGEYLSQTLERFQKPYIWAPLALLSAVFILYDAIAYEVLTNSAWIQKHIGLVTFYINTIFIFFQIIIAIFKIILGIIIDIEHLFGGKHNLNLFSQIGSDFTFKTLSISEVNTIIEDSHSCSVNFNGTTLSQIIKLTAGKQICEVNRQYWTTPLHYPLQDLTQDWYYGSASPIPGTPNGNCPPENDDLTNWICIIFTFGTVGILCVCIICILIVVCSKPTVDLIRRFI